MGKVIVYGYSQVFAVNMKVKVYANGILKGEVSKDDKLEFNIDSDTNIEFKCSFRKANIKVYNDRVNEIKISFDRLTGSIKPKMIQASTDKEKIETPRTNTVYEVPEGKKLSTKLLIAY